MDDRGDLARVRRGFAPSERVEKLSTQSTDEGVL